MPTLTGELSLCAPVAPIQTFEPRLEALRGVAALVVAGAHSLVIFEMTKWETRGVYLMGMVLNGHAAISIFFVLSGYVLSKGLRSNEQPFWPNTALYSVRRILRIYPAVIVSLAAIATALWLHKSPEARIAADSHWYATFFGAYASPFDTAMFSKNATLQTFTLNPVMWTLRIELICSACLPFLHALSRHASRRCQWGIFGALCVLPLAHISPSTFLPLFMFYLGYQMSGSGMLNWSKLIDHVQGKWWLVWLTMLTSVTLTNLFQAPAVMKGLAALAEGLCGSLVVARIVHPGGGPLLHLLDLRFSKLLGRLSYSFYLVHLPILFFVLEPVWRYLPTQLPFGLPIIAGFAVWAVSVAIALPLSWLLYWIAEKPGIVLARKLKWSPIRPRLVPVRSRLKQERESIPFSDLSRV